MSWDVVHRWIDRFRRDAAKDDMRLLRKHLKRVGLPDEPEKLVEGTIMYTIGCCAYLDLERRSIKEFIAMQSYRPALDPDFYYSFTFNLRELTFGRLISPLVMKFVDFFDLFNHPWNEFKKCGYSDFRVARLDDKALSEDEIEELENVIIDDIRFDSTEEEVNVYVDPDTVDGVLLAYVQDVYDDWDL